MIALLAGLVVWAVLIAGLLGIAALLAWSAREAYARPWLAAAVVAAVLAAPVAVRVARRVERAFTPRAAIRYDPPKEEEER